MKTLLKLLSILVITLFISSCTTIRPYTNTYTNYNIDKHPYRGTPSLGETISLVGAGMLTTAIALPYNKPRSLVYSGFMFCFIGVTIDINSHDHKRR